MATYMRIGKQEKGDDIWIAGDVSEARHKDWIELSSFEFGSDWNPSEASVDFETGEVTNSPSGGFRNSGLKLSKRVGSDSTKILDWAIAGEARYVEIHCCRETGEPYMSVHISKALVQSFEQSVEEKEASEDLELLFETIEFQAMAFDKDQKRLAERRLAKTKTPREESIAVGSGAAGVPSQSGLGVGNRAERSPAQAAADEAAESLWTGKEDPEFVQEDRILEIDKCNGVEFLLGGFVGSEVVSGLFSFRLEVVSEDLNVEARDVIGQAVAFRIKDDDNIDKERKSPPREFHGIVAEMYAGQKGVDYRNYTLVVVPWLWLLTKRTDCRIFQKKTVVQIVEEVFKGLGFKDYSKSNVRGTYPELEFCVQYRETDFGFVSRLLEENGIFYFWRFTKGKHEMILADSAVAHADCAQKDVVQSHGGVEEKHIRKWVKHLSHVSGQVRFRDYNHTTPKETLESEAASVVDLPKIKDYELYDYPGRYPTVAAGKARAKARIEAEEVAHCVVAGDSNCDAFMSGAKFTIKEHECEEEEGQEFVLTGLVHRVYMLPNSNMKGQLYCFNQFECIPKSVTFRPARLTPRPTVNGPQTAVVVGKSGEEIEPDEFGAVKVQFHWDRAGKKDENSSCFVRVAQPIAGKNWGAQWLPRIGQEVVVEFLEGDPDRPLITGSVYNKEQMPPYALPANKTQSGVKTRSSKDGTADNCNELRFEDKKGSEQVYFHAEKDFERVVENDDKLLVGTEKDKTGSQTITIVKDRSIEVLEGNETYTVKKGNRTVTVETGDDAFVVKKGNSDFKVETGNHSAEVKGNHTLDVKGNHGIKSGAKSTIEAQSGIDIKVGGSTISIKPSGITLKSGGNTIELAAGGITIKGAAGVTMKGMKIEVAGDIQTEIKGAMVDVKGAGMLKLAAAMLQMG